MFLKRPKQNLTQMYFDLPEFKKFGGEVSLCRICKRRLRNPVSEIIGIGPYCRKKKLK